MPGMITHYLGGCQVLQNLKGHRLGGLIDEHRKVYNLGTQGPDIFFYCRTRPRTAGLDTVQTGDRLHTEKVNAFFAHATNYIMHQNGRERNLLTAYLCGYICHYALDCRAHPYVYYRTGFNRPGESAEAKHTCAHRRFETAVDVLMLERLLAKKPADLKAHSLISPAREDLRAVGRLYRFVLQNAYGTSISEEHFCSAVRDMVVAQAALRDPTGLKMALLVLVEKLLNRPPLISSMVYPAGISNEPDYLNLQRRPWRLPWDNSRSSSLSFPELFWSAVCEAGELCLALDCCLYRGDSPAPFLEKIGNRSLATGLDCELDLVFRHYECIFDR